MEELKWIIQRHAATVKFILVVIILALAAMLGTCAYRQHGIAVGTIVVDDELESEGDVDEEAALDQALDRRVLAKRGSYDEATKELVSFLSANTWTADSETSALTFTPRTMREVTERGENRQAYVISAVELKKSTVDGKDIEQTTFSIETSQGTHIAVLTKTFGKGTISATLSSECFQEKKDWTLSRAATSIEVVGFDEAWCESTGTDRDAVIALLGEHCAKHYPTATTATWVKTVTEDFEAGVRTISFTLNNKRGSTVVIAVPMDGKQPTVKTR